MDDEVDKKEDESVNIEDDKEKREDDNSDDNFDNCAESRRMECLERHKANTCVEVQ